MSTRKMEKLTKREITVAILTGEDEEAGEAAVRAEELSAQPRTVQLLTYLFIG